MLRKMIALLLGTMMLAGTMTGCGSTAANPTGTVSSGEEDAAADVDTTEKADASESAQANVVTVDSAYGEVEIPYAPERICVLDLSTMDMIDALGLGEKVVCLQWAKHYPDYLESYYNSETIISLTGGSSYSGGSSAQEDTDADADPYEIYYGIDADVIIGTTERITEELYEVLAQIAPTVALPQAVESADGMYAGMRENAAAVASIWGMDEAFEKMAASGDALYEELQTALSEKTFVMTSGNTDLSTLQTGYSGKPGSTSSGAETSAKSEQTSQRTDASSGSAQKSGKKSNTANISAFLKELGMTDLTENVSKDADAQALTAAVENGMSKEAAADTVIGALNAVQPDAVFVFNYAYSSLDELREAGFDLLHVDELESPTCFVSIELSYTAGGYTAMNTTMEQMAAVFLDDAQ